MLMFGQVTQEINAPESGVVTKHFAEEDDTVFVGHDLYSLKPGPVEAKATKETPGT